MRPHVVVPGLLAAIALIALIAGSFATSYGLANGNLGASLSIAVGSIGVLVGAAAFVLKQRLAKPIDALARELSTFGKMAVDRPFEVPVQHFLAPLPDAAVTVVDALKTARGLGREALDAARRGAEEHKSRLEAILLDLSEGVLVCNLQHRILLYNSSAARILDAREALGLDRSVFGLLARDPIIHMLDQMDMNAPLPAGEGGETEEARHAQDSRHFVCASVDQGTLLQTRLSLVRDASGKASGYVMTFADVGAELENLALRDDLLREVAVEWRRPLASLKAAAETLTENTDLEPDERLAFEQIVAGEVETLSKQFAEVTQRYDRAAAGPWPMADLYSLDLFRTLAKHLQDKDGLRLTPIGVPMWLYADGHSLMLSLEHLVRAVAGTSGITAFDIEARMTGQHAYVEILWDGASVPLGVIGTWLQEPLKGSIGNRTVVQIVERHGGELWSQQLPNGRACLRFPLRVTDRASARQKMLSKQAPRPEFYDLDLFHIHDSALEDVPLRKMNFVVFDTETTGLRPTEGDELLSIGAVRVVNGRILTSDTFERLIDPKRDIPAISTKIHGISAADVAGKPPVEVVLPQFKSYVGDSCLVAYNAAFDLKFLEMKEASSGVKFDNPVLDAQLLSIYLQPELAEHSLNSIAHQFGHDVISRHTAVGDALTTAAVFVTLLDLLAARGIETFGQAIAISSYMMESRKAMLNV